MDADVLDRALIGAAALQPVQRPTREQAMEAVRTLIAWAGSTITTQFTGVFKTDPTLRQRFLDFVNKR
jgi:hypothetical protein